MTSQLSLLENNSITSITSRHLNREVYGCAGLQSVDTVSGLRFLAGFLTPEQVIVNEYRPGQGIAMHIDHPGFGPTVCTISLLDDWEMDFSVNWKDKSPALLQQGSCVLLTGDARSVWQHGIAPRKSELTGNGRRNRKRRLSLTFRTVNNRDGLNDG